MIKKNNSQLFSSILYILIGTLLIIFRSETLQWAMSAIGLFFLISGALDLLKSNYHSGAVSLIIGALILLLGWVAATIVLMVLGILIAVKGLVALLDLIKYSTPRTLQLISPIFSIVLGLMLAFGNGLDVIIILVGALLIINGGVGLLGEFKR